MEKGLKQLLIDELHDLLSAEEQIIRALPAMARAAQSPKLKEAFQTHLKETRGQVQRLKKAFTLLKVKSRAKLCKAMKGLIDEGKEVLQDFKTKSALRDAALISKAQRIEHYEMAAYGTVHSYAKELDEDDVADLLKDTLNEEGDADKLLTTIAEGGLLSTGVNEQANEEEKPKKRSTARVKAARPKARRTKSKK